MKTSSLGLLEKSQLPPVQARAILQVMESELATRDDLKGWQTAVAADFKTFQTAMTTDFRSFQSAMITDFKAFQSTMTADFRGFQSVMAADLESKTHGLELKMERLRSDLIRWNFAFWVTQMGAIVALFKMLR